MEQAPISEQSLRAGWIAPFHHAAKPGLVSVVIPTYNRAPILGRAIESALAQTYGNLEVVVSDDGSHDNTRAVAEAYGQRVTYIHQANAGVSAARNFGMQHVRGEFIAFLDSDDTWQPWKIEAQVAALQRHSTAGVVWTDMTAIGEAGDIIKSRYLRVMYAAYRKVDIDQILNQVDTVGALGASTPWELASAVVREGDLYSPILLGNLIHTSTVLFRRLWCERTGGFDESFVRAGEDYEFYIRLCSAGPVIFLDVPSAFYRIGAVDQLTSPRMHPEIARNNLRAIQKWVPRSRPRLALPRRVLRRRFAESFAWLGEAELDAGHRLSAIYGLFRSFALMPGIDRRVVLLATCVLPAKTVERLRSARNRFLRS